MNLLQLRTEFAMRTGRYDLVDPDTFADTGADNYLNLAQELLDRLLPAEMAQSRHIVQIGRGEMLVPLHRCMSVKEVWRTASDGLVELSPYRFRAFREEYPACLVNHYDVCVNGGFDEDLSGWVYTDYGDYGWNWLDGKARYTGDASVFTDSLSQGSGGGSYIRDLELTEYAGVIRIYFTISDVIAGTEMEISGDFTPTPVNADLVCGRQALDFTCTAVGTGTVYFHPGAGNEATDVFSIDDVRVVIGPVDALNGTPATYVPVTHRPAPKIAADLPQSFEGMYDWRDTVRNQSGNLQQSVLVYPPPETTATIEIVGRFYSKKLVNDTDETFWTAQHWDLVIAAAMLKLDGLYGNRERYNQLMENVISEMGIIDNIAVEIESNQYPQMRG